VSTVCTITNQDGDRYEIDDDPARIDHDAAIAFLTTQAYWGRWRDAAVITGQISAAWRVVGAYDGRGAMVGFARAFGDNATAYLADVYVLPEHRGAGLGKALVRAMIDDGPGAGQRWMLHTSDAHGLYRQFGFAAPGASVLERPRESRAGATGSPGTDPLETGMLKGEHVRLEPLAYRHAAGLLDTSRDAGDLHQWMGYLVPRTKDEVRVFIESSLRDREAGKAVPYAAVRSADGEVIGSTRFHSPDFWPWPQARTAPDTVEIGWTWLSPGAVRTAANTEMKTLMLTHAFETWRVHSVCLHADARNARSRAAIERIGARFEGILRAHRLAADLIPRESARYSITADEWPAVRRHLAELANR
jgi:RimJ/RimL family protein N-acetyltransferase